MASTQTSASASHATGGFPRLEHPGVRLDGYLSIEDYAAIGEGHSLALVGLDDSIDWMCLPRLDSPSVFAALLDGRAGGRFVLQPAVAFDVQRSYIERTNVLQTTFQTAEGDVRLTDWLSFGADGNTKPARELVRRVEGLSGTVPMRWELRPRFDYGRHAAVFERGADLFLAHHGTLMLGFQAWDAGEPYAETGALTAKFDISSGQQAVLNLVAADGTPLPTPRRRDTERRLTNTVSAWQAWVGRHTYEGPWKRAVERSLLAIGLLADRRSGAITAAGTTSLPEVLGGQRNFDYRFGWTRDCSFSVDALLSVGLEDLPQASVAWLLEATRHTHPRVDPVYGLAGDVVRSQRELSLSGYRGTGPAHVGNKAGSQLQLGGVGDLMQTIWRSVQHGSVLPQEVGQRLADMADLLCLIWRRQDAGLWELGDYAQYGTSKVGCWVALDRLLELVKVGQVPSRNVQRWRHERDAIRDFIDGSLWSDTLSSYLFRSDRLQLDCGLLLIARRGYVEPGSPRLTGTIQAIERNLAAGDGLFYRYSGMQDQENAFLACSFWMVEALTVAGRHEDAEALMSTATGWANDVGLLSEEMDADTRAMRGNFPQALTHLALISAAAILSARPGGRKKVPAAGGRESDARGRVLGEDAEIWIGAGWLSSCLTASWSGVGMWPAPAVSATSRS